MRTISEGSEIRRSSLYPVVYTPLEVDMITKHCCKLVYPGICTNVILCIITSNYVVHAQYFSLIGRGGGGWWVCDGGAEERREN